MPIDISAQIVYDTDMKHEGQQRQDKDMRNYYKDYYFDIDLEIYFDDLGDYTETRVNDILDKAGAWSVCITDIIHDGEDDVKVKASVTLTIIGYSEEAALEDAMEPIRRALLKEANDYDWELDRVEVVA